MDKTAGSNSSEEDATALLAHVKSTLMMYLKKCPIIDEANESLLGILYSMMKVSKEDKDEVARARASLPVYVIDESKTKKKQKDSSTPTGSKGGFFGAFKRSLTNSASSAKSKDESGAVSTGNEESKTKDKIKKGLTSLFGATGKESKSRTDKFAGSLNKDLEVKPRGGSMIGRTEESLGSANSNGGAAGHQR